MQVMLLAYSPSTGRAIVRREGAGCYLVQGPPHLDTPVYRGLLDHNALPMTALRQCPPITNADRFREGNVLTLLGIAGFFLLANYSGERAETKVRARVAARRRARAEARA
jgi:hypothetical protein